MSAAAPATPIETSMQTTLAIKTLMIELLPFRRKRGIRETDYDSGSSIFIISEG
jgi:hypothetical protein